MSGNAPAHDLIVTRDARGGGSIPSMGEIGLNQFAPYLLNRISARWNADIAEALKAQNMTTVQMRILAVLAVNSGLTVNELAVLTVTEQSTMSRTLDSLEEQRMIRRQARSGDARVREVHILDAGRDAFAKVWPVIYAQQAHLFDGVSAEEYQAFIATLHKMLRNIRKHEI
jgi:DNA-binding MarR family transcriptional regulator